MTTAAASGPLADSPPLPERAIRLDWAGAAPFAIGALPVWLVHEDVRPYAALGLSLAAWPALLMPPGAGLAMLGALLVGCYLVDRRLYPVYGVAHWLTLRFRLGAAAALSCFIGAAGS